MASYPVYTGSPLKPVCFLLLAHPYPEQGKQSDYYLKLDTDKAITYGLICDGGLLDKDDNLLKVDEDGYCQIDEHMFDKDALCQALDNSLTVFPALRPDT